MNHKILNKHSQEEVTNLFTSVFTASEGEKEGRLIGDLASEAVLRVLGRVQEKAKGGEKTQFTEA